MTRLHQDLNQEMTVRTLSLIHGLKTLLGEDDVHVVPTTPIFKEFWVLEKLSKRVNHLIYIYHNQFTLNLVCHQRFWPTVRRFKHISFFTFHLDHHHVLPLKSIESSYTREYICNHRPVLPDVIKSTLALSHFNFILSGVQDSLQYAQYALPCVKVLYIPPHASSNFELIIDKPKDVINMYLDMNNNSTWASNQAVTFILNVVAKYRELAVHDPSYLPINLFASQPLPLNVSSITDYHVGSSNASRTSFITMLTSLHIYAPAVRYGAEGTLIDAQAHGALLLAPRDFVKQELYPLHNSIVSSYTERCASRLHAYFNSKTVGEFNTYAKKNIAWAKERFSPELSAAYYLQAFDYGGKLEATTTD